MKNIKPKGFDGLKDLTSTLEITNVKSDEFSSENVESVENIELEASEQSKVVGESKENQSEDTDGRVSKPQEKSSSGFSMWALVVIVVTMFIVFKNTTNNKETSNLNVKSNAIQNENKSKHEDKYNLYSTPPVSKNEVFNKSQIRWCLRENIKLEIVRSNIETTSNDSVNEFNKLITNFNSRCSNYRYYDGDLTRAKKDVESKKIQIERSVDFFINNWRSKGDYIYSKNDIVMIQSRLKALNYNVGIIDGFLGDNTSSAIKMFKKDNGIYPVNDKITSILITTLKL